MPKSIPKDIKEQVLQIVDTYNEENETHFEITFRGQFAYLAKREERETNQFLEIIAKRMGVSMDKFPKQQDSTIETKLGRLKYNGKIDNWDFAVFRYSREFYDPDEFMFPGSGELDGTIEGALNAGLQIY